MDKVSYKSLKEVIEKLSKSGKTAHEIALEIMKAMDEKTNTNSVLFLKDLDDVN